MQAKNERRFQFFRGWLLIASCGFALQGVVWACLGSFDPWGIWDGFMFSAFFEDAQDAEVIRFRRFILGPFGATLSGYFVMVALTVYFAFPSRAKWAYGTVAAGILTWFAIDCAASAAHSAYFNILLVNVPCIIILGIPMLGLWPFFMNSQHNHATRS